MNCPVCKSVALAAAELLPGLAALTCPQCQGSFIPAARYWSWLDSRTGQPLPTSPNADLAASMESRATTSAAATGNGPAADTPPGKLCPECHHFLRRVLVGNGLPFGLDRCATCGGFWLDRGEFDSLRSHHLHDRLHLIAAPDFQAHLAAEQRETAHLALLREHLGPGDLAEIQRIRKWLEGHPKRSQLYAYLLSAAASVPGRD